MKQPALLLLLVSSAAWAQSSADDHMLAGARYFQAGRFTEALVEFRVAERAAADVGATWYVAATLVKLKRPEDAIMEFARAEAIAPADRDALFDYYHALACYEGRLYFCADRLLAAVGEQAGPRIAAQARKIHTDLRPIISAPPAPAVIDWYHARAQGAIKAARVSLAMVYYEEAASLAALRPDGYRRGEARAALARARPSPSRQESAR
jgi:hypothetical protein